MKFDISTEDDKKYKLDISYSVEDVDLGNSFKVKKEDIYKLYIKLREIFANSDNK